MSKKVKKVTVKISLNFKPGLTLGELYNSMAKNKTDNLIECKELQENIDSIEINNIKDYEEY
jgi:hypothetical protein